MCVRARRHGSLTHFTPWLAERFELRASDRFSLLSGLAHDPLHRDVFTPLQLGASAATDTTDAQGIARIGADEGRFWIYAAYVLPDVTLEWNVPVTIRGDSTVVRLTRENAKEQRFY